MAGFLGNWIITVTAAAALTALAGALIPKGPVKKASALVLGLVLMLAVLAPAARLDEDALSRLSLEYSGDMEGVSAAFQAANTEIMEEIIAGEMEAYILDKAAESGAAVTGAAFGFETESGVPVPVRAEIRGEYSPAVAQAVERELGIGRDCQIWS